MAKIVIEGLANLGINILHCTCKCGHSDTSGAIMEFNFMEQRVIYVCSKCKSENSMWFGKEKPPGYPRIGVGK